MTSTRTVVIGVYIITWASIELWGQKLYPGIALGIGFLIPWIGWHVSDILAKAAP